MLVKDADLYPVRILSVRLHAWDFFGHGFDWVFDVGLRCETNLLHHAFPLPLGSFKGEVRVSGTIVVEKPDGKSRVFENHNYPGLAPSPLEVRLLESPLPYPREWLAGEMHCHSEFSSDPVEFGAPLELMQETAGAVGLDFVLCTDHSYDFYYRRDNYLERRDADGNFGEYRAQVDALNARHPGMPVMLAGEEVSCGNGRGENVHMLVFGHDRFLPGLGDGGRRGFRNRPDLTLSEVLERLGETPAFAAHPKARIGWLERRIFRRGEWREEDLSPSPSGRSVRGLQFWNGNLGADYRDGKAFWIRQLLRGARLLPIGANDAHGDFNRNTGVRFPLLRLKQGRGHVFGKVRTLVPSLGRDADSLRAAFRGQSCVCTDGPFAELHREDGILRIAAFTTGDFGELRSISLLGAAAGEDRERLLADWTFEAGPLHFAERLPLPLTSGYARLEVVTRRGRRALTAAVFMD